MQSLLIFILFSLPFLASGQEMLRDECTNEELAKILNSRDFAQIENNLSALEAANVYHLPCKELNAGQSRVLALPTRFSPSGVEHFYKLSKKNNDEYQITLALDFRDSLDESNVVLQNNQWGKKNENLNEQMSNKVSRCLNIANQALLGPDGKKLSIQLAQINEHHPLPPKVKINIAPNTLAIHSSRRYTSDITCAEITHELLHLLGLADEYTEERFGYMRTPTNGELTFEKSDPANAAYDCRALGHEDSIMRSHDEAFVKVFNFWDIPTLIKCACDMPSDCKKISQTLPTNIDKCPNGTNPSYFGRFEEIDFEKYQNDGNYLNETEAEILLVRGFKATPGKSLLKPSHFNAITQPGCKTNYAYYQCSIDAYQTSKSRGGRGCLMEPALQDCRKNGSHWQAKINNQ